MSEDNLPSIEDYNKNSIQGMQQDELPSVNDFLTEEELPSVSDFVEEKEEEETVEEIIEELVEKEDTSSDLTEILHLINAVRKDIPEIPEIKYYDEQLEQLTEYIQGVRESIPEIPEIPEVRYYDEDINFIQKSIDVIKEEISNLPEVKYYEDDIESLKESLKTRIDEVAQSIPTFPKWVNEVNEVPDFSWIGKTFSVIDDDFIKVEDKINLVGGRIDSEVYELTEIIDTKDFERRVEIDEIKKTFSETKDKIYEELKEAAVKIWDHHDQFKDDDRKLKKSVLSKLNESKQTIEGKIKDLSEEHNKSQTALREVIDGYVNQLKEELKNLPEPKYYEDDILNVKNEVIKLEDKVSGHVINIAELYKLVGEIKESVVETKKELNEATVLNPDPETKQGDDPLTPIDQDFDSLAKLAKSYKLFVSRVQQQLYSIGGGGAAFIKDLDDVTFDQTTGWGQLLIYSGIGTGWTGISSLKLGATGAAGTWAVDSVGISTNKAVGIATDTAQSGYSLYVVGDTRITGILTIGTGSITLDPDQRQIKGVDEIIIGAATTITIKQDSQGEIEFADKDGNQTSVGIGTTVSINTTGIITATSFHGSGEGLTGVASTDNIITSTAATFTNATDATSTTAASVTFAGGIGIAKSVYIGGSIEVDGNISAAGTVTWEDVTNQDVLGLSTFRTGVQIGPPATGIGITLQQSGGLFAGIVTATSFVGDGSALTGVAASTTIDNQTFVVGSGGTTIFNLSQEYTTGNLDVFLNGLRLVRTSDYTETDADTITLNTAATEGDVVETKSFRVTGSIVDASIGVRSDGVSVGSSIVVLNFISGFGTYQDLGNGTLDMYLPTTNISQEIFNVGASGTTILSLSNSYTSGNIDVYRNGVRLVQGRDFTESADSEITLVTAATEADVIQTKNFKTVGNIVQSVGVQSGGVSVASSVNTLNFVGVGNTFIDRGNGIIDISVNSTGLNVSGVATATTFSGSGASLTNLPAGNLTGTVSDDRLPATITSNITGDVTGDVVGDVTGDLTGTATTATNLANAANITTGTINSARIPTLNQNTTGTAAGLTGTPDITVGTITGTNVKATGITTVTNFDATGTLVEAFSSTTTAWSSSADLNISNGNVHFSSANLGGTNNTLNIVSTAGINTDLAVGQTLSVTGITAVNSSSAYVNHITIDGVAVTESWVGGSAPSDGGSSNYDVYSFTILKTGDATFIVIGNQNTTS